MRVSYNKGFCIFHMSQNGLSCTNGGKPARQKEFFNEQKTLLSLSVVLSHEQSSCVDSMDRSHRNINRIDLCV